MNLDVEHIENVWTFDFISLVSYLLSKLLCKMYNLFIAKTGILSINMKQKNEMCKQMGHFKKIWDTNIKPGLHNQISKHSQHLQHQKPLKKSLFFLFEKKQELHNSTLDFERKKYVILQMSGFVNSIH